MWQRHLCLPPPSHPLEATSGRYLQLSNFCVEVRPVGVVRLPLESLALVEVASLDPLVERANRFHRLEKISDILMK